MRILWVSHLVPYPPKAGVLERAYHLVKELALHHETHLLCFVQRNLLKPYYENTEQGIREAKRTLDTFCASTAFFDIPKEDRPFGMTRLAAESLLTPHPYTLNWLKSREFRKALRTMLETTDFDVVHLDTISLAPYADLCSGLPVVIDHHNVESHMLLRRAENETHPFKKAYFFQEGIRLRRYERRYCSRASLNITCSEIDAQRLCTIGPGIRAEVIPNGVDLDYFAPDRPRSDGRPPKLLFLGTLDWYPNRAAVEFIADRLWPLLKECLPDIRIDVIGANPPAKIVALGNHDPSFIVHGFVDDIRIYMNDADIFLCPISDGGGTKLKVLDALSMALPIVAHPLACEGIDITNGTHVMLAETEQEYIEAIVALLQNPTLAKSLGCAGRDLIQTQYDFERIGDKLAALYTEVAGSSKKVAQCVE